MYLDRQRGLRVQQLGVARVADVLQPRLAEPVEPQRPLVPEPVGPKKSPPASCRTEFDAKPHPVQHNAISTRGVFKKFPERCVRAVILHLEAEGGRQEKVDTPHTYTQKQIHTDTHTHM